MKAEKNSPALWDKVWARTISTAEDRHHLNFEEHTIRWRRIEQRVFRHFGRFAGLDVIEVGAGRGTNAALFAKRGANVTVLDYSETALQRSQQFFDRIGYSATTVHGNALELSPNLIESFDVALSFGLTEHFLGQQRLQINQAHFDLVRPGGMVFIAVPHRNNPPYRLFKFIAERTGRWGVGEEYPYSRAEFRTICEQIGVNDYEFFGESFLQSFHFLNPLNKRLFRKWLRLGPRRYDKMTYRQQRGSFLDTPLSYSLVLCGKKPDATRQRKAS